MGIIEAFATKNKCYQVAAPLTPQGFMLHSIGLSAQSTASGRIGGKNETEK